VRWTEVHSIKIFRRCCRGESVGNYRILAYISIYKEVLIFNQLSSLWGMVLHAFPAFSQSAKNRVMPASVSGCRAICSSTL
jgi:hypothetical protein